MYLCETMCIVSVIVLVNNINVDMSVLGDCLCECSR